MKVTELSPLPYGILGHYADDKPTNDLRESDFNPALWPERGGRLAGINRTKLARAAALRPNGPVVLNGLSIL